MKYCDLDCEYAEFPTELADGSLTCRTFVALYCKKLGQLVDKNGLCQADINPDSPAKQPETNQ